MSDSAYDYEIQFTPTGTFGRGLPRAADGTVTVLRGTAAEADALAELVDGEVSGPFHRSRHTGRNS